MGCASVKGKIFRSVQANHRFWLLAAFIVAVFILGGGARDDIWSLVVLRPLAVAMIAVGLWSIGREQWVQFRGLFLLLGACIALPLIHLVPLPPGLWSSLPGREAMVEASQAAGLPLDWRPLSLVPTRTWNAFYSLLVPLAVLVLLARVSVEDRARLLPLVLALGLIDAILSVLQLVGAPDGPLYFYRITNNGAAVGLFSNRNHNAIFLLLLLPMLTLYGRQWVSRNNEGGRAKSTAPRDLRPLVLIALGLSLVTLILVAGSRGGLIIGAIALLLMPLLLTESRRGSGWRASGYFSLLAGWRGLVAAGLVAGVGALAIFFSRAAAVQRLMETGGESELRSSIWGPIAELAAKYFPVGSGVGTFVEVYQKDEPLSGLSHTYVNHAHNEVLEVLLTAGVPGMLLIFAIAIYWLRCIWPLFVSKAVVTPAMLTGRLGAIIVFLLALGSVADYPLRVPSKACLLVIGLAWLIDGMHASKSSKA